MKRNRIAVTGGIGSGKSEVLKILSGLGFAVISADEISKKINSQPETLRKIEKAFGEGFAEHGTLNSKKLGSFVFSDAKRVKKLNRITHPEIRRELRRQIRQAGNNFVFVEIPLLIETNSQKYFGRVWLVTADKEQRIKRITGRDGISREQAEQRMSKQLPDEIKSKFAHNIIINNESHSELKEQVCRCLDELRK